MLERIADGRTDLVFDYLSEGHAATSKDQDEVSLIQWCAYYGDVSALDAKDMHGDSPLSWASWHLRPASVLRKLCYGDFYIRPDYGSGMAANLLGKPRF